VKHGNTFCTSGTETRVTGFDRSRQPPTRPPGPEPRQESPGWDPEGRRTRKVGRGGSRVKHVKHGFAPSGRNTSSGLDRSGQPPPGHAQPRAQAGEPRLGPDGRLSQEGARAVTGEHTEHGSHLRSGTRVSGFIGSSNRPPDHHPRSRARRESPGWGPMSQAGPGRWPGGSRVKHGKHGSAPPEQNTSPGFTGSSNQHQVTAPGPGPGRRA